MPTNTLAIFAKAYYLNGSDYLELLDLNGHTFISEYDTNPDQYIRINVVSANSSNPNITDLISNINDISVSILKKDILGNWSDVKNSTLLSATIGYDQFSGYKIFQYIIKVPVGEYKFTLDYKKQINITTTNTFNYSVIFKYLDHSHMVPSISDFSVTPESGYVKLTVTVSPQPNTNGNFVIFPNTGQEYVNKVIWSYKKTDSTTWMSINVINPNSTFSFTLDKPGSYELKLEAYEFDPTIYQPSAFKIYSSTINVLQLSNLDFDINISPDAPYSIGQTIRATLSLKNSFPKNKIASMTWYDINNPNGTQVNLININNIDLPYVVSFNRPGIFAIKLTLIDKTFGNEVSRFKRIKVYAGVGKKYYKIYVSSPPEQKLYVKKANGQSYTEEEYRDALYDSIKEGMKNSSLFFAPRTWPEAGAVYDVTKEFINGRYAVGLIVNKRVKNYYNGMEKFSYSEIPVNTNDPPEGGVINPRGAVFSTPQKDSVNVIRLSTADDYTFKDTDWNINVTKEGLAKHPIVLYAQNNDNNNLNAFGNIGKYTNINFAQHPFQPYITILKKDEFNATKKKDYKFYAFTYSSTKNKGSLKYNINHISFINPFDPNHLKYRQQQYKETSSFSNFGSMANLYGKSDIISFSDPTLGQLRNMPTFPYKGPRGYNSVAQIYKNGKPPLKYSETGTIYSRKYYTTPGGTNGDGSDYNSVLGQLSADEDASTIQFNNYYGQPYNYGSVIKSQKYGRTALFITFDNIYSSYGELLKNNTIQTTNTLNSFNIVGTINSGIVGVNFKFNVNSKYLSNTPIKLLSRLSVDNRYIAYAIEDSIYMWDQYLLKDFGPYTVGDKLKISNDENENYFTNIIAVGDIFIPYNSITSINTSSKIAHNLPISSRFFGGSNILLNLHYNNNKQYWMVDMGTLGSMPFDGVQEIKNVRDITLNNDYDLSTSKLILASVADNILYYTTSNKFGFFNVGKNAFTYTIDTLSGHIIEGASGVSSISFDSIIGSPSSDQISLLLNPENEKQIISISGESDGVPFISSAPIVLADVVKPEFNKNKIFTNEPNFQNICFSIKTHEWIPDKISICGTQLDGKDAYKKFFNQDLGEKPEIIVTPIEPNTYNISASVDLSKFFAKAKYPKAGIDYQNKAQAGYQQGGSSATWTLGIDGTKIVTNDNYIGGGIPKGLVEKYIGTTINNSVENYGAIISFKITLIEEQYGNGLLFSESIPPTFNVSLTNYKDEIISSNSFFVAIKKSDAHDWQNPVIVQDNLSKKIYHFYECAVFLPYDKTEISSPYIKININANHTLSGIPYLPPLNVSGMIKFDFSGNYDQEYPIPNKTFQYCYKDKNVIFNSNLSFVEVYVTPINEFYNEDILETPDGIGTVIMDIIYKEYTEKGSLSQPNIVESLFKGDIQKIGWRGNDIVFTNAGREFYGLTSDPNDQPKKTIVDLLNNFNPENPNVTYYERNDKTISRYKVLNGEQNGNTINKPNSRTALDQPPGDPSNFNVFNQYYADSIEGNYLVRTYLFKNYYNIPKDSKSEIDGLKYILFKCISWTAYHPLSNSFNVSNIQRMANMLNFNSLCKINPKNEEIDTVSGTRYITVGLENWPTAVKENGFRGNYEQNYDEEMLQKFSSPITIVNHNDIIISSQTDNNQSLSIDISITNIKGINLPENKNSFIFDNDNKSLKITNINIDASIGEILTFGEISSSLNNNYAGCSMASENGVFRIISNSNDHIIVSLPNYNKTSAKNLINSLLGKMVAIGAFLPSRVEIQDPLNGPNIGSNFGNIDIIKTSLMIKKITTNTISYNTISCYPKHKTVSVELIENFVGNLDKTYSYRKTIESNITSDIISNTTSNSGSSKTQVQIGLYRRCDKSKGLFSDPLNINIFANDFKSYDLTKYETSIFAKISSSRPLDLSSPMVLVMNSSDPKIKTKLVYSYANNINTPNSIKAIRILNVNGKEGSDLMLVELKTSTQVSQDENTIASLISEDALNVINIAFKAYDTNGNIVIYGDESVINS